MNANAVGMICSWVVLVAAFGAFAAVVSFRLMDRHFKLERIRDDLWDATFLAGEQLDAGDVIEARATLHWAVARVSPLLGHSTQPVDLEELGEGA